MKVIPDTRHAH